VYGFVERAIVQDISSGGEEEVDVSRRRI